MSRRLRSTSSPLVPLAALVALLLSLALLPAGAATAAASAPSPGQDFPRMPAACATVQEKIPQKPVICKLNDFRKNRPTIVLWGDSHAWMMIPALRAATQGRNVNLVATVMGSCPPMDPALTAQTRKRAASCERNNDMALRYVKGLKRGDEALRVVLGGSWYRYLRALRAGDKTYVGQQAKKLETDLPRLMRTLGRARIGTDMIGQVATVPAERAACRAGNQPYACDIKRGRALKSEGDVRRSLVTTMRPLSGNPSLIDVNPFFCDSRVCHGRVDGVRTFFDDLHLSASMSQRLRGYFKVTVDKVRPPRQQQQENPPESCSFLGVPVPC